MGVRVRSIVAVPHGFGGSKDAHPVQHRLETSREAARQAGGPPNGVAGRRLGPAH